MKKDYLSKNMNIKLFYELKKAEYVESFNRANNDPEMLCMADEGLDDYIEILTRFEFTPKTSH